MGRSEEAVNCYDKAIEINPNDAAAWYGKGLALKQIGHPEEALNCYEKAMDISPNISRAWYNKGLVLYQLKRYKEAKKCFKKSEHPQAQQMLKHTIKRLERGGH